MISDIVLMILFLIALDWWDDLLSPSRNDYTGGAKAKHRKR